MRTKRCGVDWLACSLDALVARQVPRPGGAAASPGHRGQLGVASARRGRVQPGLGALSAAQSALPEAYLARSEKTLLAQLVSAPAATLVSLWTYSTPMYMRPLKNWLAE